MRGKQSDVIPASIQVSQAACFKTKLGWEVATILKSLNPPILHCKFFIHHLHLPFLLPPSSKLGGLLKSFYRFCFVESPFLSKIPLKIAFSRLASVPPDSLFSCLLQPAGNNWKSKGPKLPRKSNLQKFHLHSWCTAAITQEQAPIKVWDFFLPYTHEFLFTFLKTCILKTARPQAALIHSVFILKQTLFLYKKHWPHLGSAWYNLVKSLIHFQALNRV